MDLRQLVARVLYIKDRDLNKSEIAVGLSDWLELDKRSRPLAHLDWMKTMTKKPKDVDSYIASAPSNTRAKLKELRAIIKAAAPESIEKISYGMPYYSHNGRLAYFSFWKEHIGLYLPTPVIEEHESDLKAYETTKATVRFPLNKKLPASLIKKLIKARLKKNDAKAAVKK